MATKPTTKKTTPKEKVVKAKVAAPAKPVESKLPRQVDYAVIKRPMLTEKTNRLAEQKEKVVSFLVDIRATKTELKEAFERIFGVNVVNIRTASLPLKGKRAMRGASVNTSKKKAYVTLKEGQTINVVEGI